MVKKSTHFENLNSLKVNTTENIILREFLKNINAHINYLKNNFPDFWENYYCLYFSNKITISNLNLKASKSTIEILKILFEEYDITNEKYDNDFVNKYKQNQLFYFYEKNLTKFNIKKTNLKAIADFCNINIRAERT